ncbi:MAG TPA: polysaccharide biosynthesis/export family protein [Polyangiaceae bacterium]|nr:polysaccharide biosynthesis/export family protein [Polyangiaceae bacterium]HNZ21768.1 polysaccharide biosynthesis/export family protein [Polyangiaceae bacterium]HOD25025.1 polysaccharide biosynthesis/export family protein [Polyangiaceae bacterium]HOE51359.1 polysaccharide biosynthesis/export family protein [Polyangiaceae bacterium]HOG99671.1 polysaccharide biosynthesis/export family protein [Polyangiaceae bacterium]
MSFGLCALFVSSCAAPMTNRVNLPPPVESTTIGPGDTFELFIVGEDKIPTAYTVSPDGTVDFPYIHRQRVVGLEPQQVVDLVREQLQAQGILSDPSVMVNMKEYRSKFVNILGQVKSPGTFPLVPGFTLVQAISKAGGPSPIADSDNVRLTRTTNGERRTLRVSLRSITEGRSPDIPLQSGDVITIAERVF